MPLARFVTVTGRVIRLSPTTADPLHEKGGNA
jgi:hypothetical protein